MTTLTCNKLHYLEKFSEQCLKFIKLSSVCFQMGLLLGLLLKLKDIDLPGNFKEMFKFSLHERACFLFIDKQTFCCNDFQMPFVYDMRSEEIELHSYFHCEVVDSRWDFKTR